MRIEMQVSPDLKLVADGETHVDLFESLASMQEVFGDDKCGKCGGKLLRFVVRTNDGNKYHELHCDSWDTKLNDGKGAYCRAKLSFSVKKKPNAGALFPVRFQRKEGEYVKDANDKMIPRGSHGWVRWNPTTKQEE